MCVQDGAGVMALKCKQHVDLENKEFMSPCGVKIISSKGVCVHVGIKTLRYRNPMVDTTAAVNPIVMASHG